jgi:TPP-dependent indolepyruvate ferredoxin oxidoreductase alpha subunit
LGRTFQRRLKAVLVIEELEPEIEREFIYLYSPDHLPVQIKGKPSGAMPEAGEYTVSQITERLRAFPGVGSKGTGPWNIPWEHCTAWMVCIKKPGVLRFPGGNLNHVRVHKPAIDPARCGGCGICPALLMRLYR